MSTVKRLKKSDIVKVKFFKFDHIRNRYLDSIGIIVRVARVAGTNQKAYRVRYYNPRAGKVVEEYYHDSALKVINPEKDINPKVWEVEKERLCLTTPF
ncbi:hypothetical protein ACFO25_09820 [Paenactinomyces guangxiensis]|uniref:Uncharacterized protein n=1 Tax=Paenactinomyces guangxiensis TaxID=1490290 RepID=A0A7W1WS72_9BACL|nr:hypothetical protein [Paenactinomyces guangxiensis]MBA4495081.1 hypothetical protein [Paenactinomyces guangxiensis]MBH8592235.1 hypothetical protein [Paenactinomyces guangxiensis]